MNETLDTILIVLCFIASFAVLSIWWEEFILAITTTRNAKKHGTYDKQPDPHRKCTKCKRPLVKKTNGNMYCAWCDIESYIQ